MDDGVRLPNRSRSYQQPEPATTAPKAKDESVYVRSKDAEERQSRRGLWFGVCVVFLALAGAVAYMVFRPRPRLLDTVETVADRYLSALEKQDEEAIAKLGVVEEPPGIGSYGNVTHLKSRDRTVKGSFATLGAFHKKIDEEYVYDAGAERFTPKKALSIAAETLEKLEAQKEEAKKSGMYEKMQSGDPNDVFDSAEQLGKMMEKVAESLPSKRIIPTYKMLVEAANPPLADEAKILAMAFAENPKRWQALLKRPFWTLKPDGPFVYEEAVVTATGRDRLASLGDPPTRYRLDLVRFRLEGIDTGWKVVSARRYQPGDDKPPAPRVDSAPAKERPSPGDASPYSTGASARAGQEIPKTEKAAPKASQPGF